MHKCVFRRLGVKTGQDSVGDRLKDRSKLCGKPQKKILSWHFDYFSPSNAKASTITVFPEVSLVSLPLGSRNFFKRF